MIPSDVGKVDSFQKDLPGGLLLEFPLQECPLHTIFTKIVEADFCFDALDEEFKEGAKYITDGMFEKPHGLQNYVTKQRIYVSLSWANDKLQLENTACDSCTVTPLEGSVGLFKVQLEVGFCEHNEIRSSSLLTLERDDDINCHVSGRVVEFDPASSTLTFVPFGRKRINATLEYRVSVMPSSFCYRSRCRTLNWLATLNREEIIFPKPCESSISSSDFERAERDVLPRMKFSRDLNECQKKAVYAIVSGHHRTLPYILHGPPGTGKTTALVEAVRILLEDSRRNARVLVCAPSNMAADLFATELLNKAKVPAEKLFRMYSLLRPVEAQNKELRSVSCVIESGDGEEVFGIYRFDELLKRQVIVSTLSASTYLVSGGLNGKFTHIIIDEAGQANEVDTLIPMVGLATLDTRIVLAGDPHQLGPVEPLEFLNKNDLTKSLLERFADLACYKNDRRFMSMLEVNYRSHATIIKIPSELFYGYRLMTAGTGVFVQKNGLSNWMDLPNKGFPIIFHNVDGHQVQEASGFSYCNMEECDLVVEYVKRIESTLHVNLEDIGVITPYKYQVRAIRQALVDYPGITVDSVERFQGSERRVIIVSTVRVEKLGFVKDAKRFNTTVMRAEELLIVIGNFVTLNENPFWERFLGYCVANNAVKDLPIAADSGNSENGDDAPEDEEVIVVDSSQ